MGRNLGGKSMIVGVLQLPELPGHLSHQLGVLLGCFLGCSWAASPGEIRARGAEEVAWAPNLHLNHNN